MTEFIVCCVFLKLGCVTQSATIVCLLMVLAFPFELTETKLGLGNLKGEWCASTWMTGGVIEAVTVRKLRCTTDVELLSVSLRPRYLAREFGQLFLTVVYVPPSANAVHAASEITDIVHALQMISPEAPNFILGDLIHSTCDPVCQLLNNMLHAQSDQTKQLIFATAVFLNLIFINLYLSHL